MIGAAIGRAASAAAALVLRYGGRIIAVAKKGKTFKKLYAAGKGASATIAQLGIAEALVWAVKQLLGGKGGGDGYKQFRSLVVDRVQNVEWASDRVKFLNQIEAYINRGPAERAVIAQALSDAGYSIEVDQVALDLLSEGGVHELDERVIGMFETLVQSSVGDKDPGTRSSTPLPGGLEAKMLLVRELAPLAGGWRNLRKIQTLMFVMEKGDWEAFERLERTFR